MEKKYTCKDCANFGQQGADMYCGPNKIPEIKENAEVCDKFVYDGSNTIKNLKKGDIVYIQRVQDLFPHVQQVLVSKIDSDNTIWVTLEYGDCCKLSAFVSKHAVHNTYEHAYKAACLTALNSSLTLKEKLDTELAQVQLKIRTNEKRIEKMRQEIDKQED
jgi:NAD-dependent DNA ligase